MKDKLVHKRVNWPLVLATLGLNQYFYRDPTSKVKSLNKACFIWFLKKFGRKYVKIVRTDCKYMYNDDLLREICRFRQSQWSFDDVVRIAKTNWIKFPEED